MAELDQAATVVSIRGLGVDVGARTILDGIDLDVAPGEALVLIGPSGAGKSTLLNVLAGLITPSRGSVTRRPASVGYLFQEPALFEFDGFTVGENLSVVLEARGRDPHELPTLLESVDLPPGLAGQSPGSLSGGQRRRVALARSLAARPELLLCDEPTAGLDPLGLRNVADLIRRVVKGTSIGLILVTHDLLAASLVADRVLFLPGGQGRLETLVTPDEVLSLRGQDPLPVKLVDLLQVRFVERLGRQGSSPVQAIARTTGLFWEPVLGFLEALGEWAFILGGLFRPSRRGASLRRFMALGPPAAASAALASFFVGLIVVLQSQRGLSRFEATHLLPEVAMGSLVREVLPLFVGLILAGRLGAAVASEVGNVALSKQLESLRLLGLDPLALIAGPVLRACGVVVPLAILLGIAGGILGAGFGGIEVLGLNASLFWEGTRRSVDLGDLLLSVAKGLFFGIAIAGSAVRWAFKTKNRSEELGDHTTGGIVEASFLVVLGDLVLTRLLH